MLIAVFQVFVKCDFPHMRTRVKRREEEAICLHVVARVIALFVLKDEAFALVAGLN